MDAVADQYRSIVDAYIYVEIVTVQIADRLEKVLTSFRRNIMPGGAVSRLVTSAT